MNNETNNAAKAKKITKATFKAFVKKNAGKLLIKVRSAFDGMVDGCVGDPNATFHPIVKSDRGFNEHTLGYAGVWLVNGGGDRFNAYNKDGIVGIEVYNSCGTFIVAIASEPAAPVVAAAAVEVAAENATKAAAAVDAAAAKVEAINPAAKFRVRVAIGDQYTDGFFTVATIRAFYNRGYVISGAPAAIFAE